MIDLESLWNEVKRYLREELTKSTFETWILGLKPIDLTADSLVLEAFSKLHKEHIESHYAIQIRQVVAETIGRDVNLEIRIQDEARNKTTSSSYLETSPSDNEEDIWKNNPYHQHSIHLNPKYTFENFVVGEGNKMAHAAALAVAEDPGRDYNPLFLFGGVGLGKTHLMQAIGHEVLRRHPNSRVKYVTSEMFTNDYIQSLQRHDTPLFQEEYRTVDILLVDDIQFIGNKESTQEAFFHTFNTLYNQNKHIVLTSDRDASQIPDLEDRLVSRFKQGLSTDITPPDLETRIAILRNKAEANNIEVPSDTLNYLAGQVDTNIRELEGALTSLQAYASMNKEPMTLDVAARSLRKYRSNNTHTMPTIEDIQKTVAKYFDLSVNDLVGKRRNRPIVIPRQIAMYLARELTEASLPNIGREFGGKDHTTVMHAHDKIAEELKSSRDLQNDIANIKKLI